jgi:carboxylate-amine ligase
MAERWVPLAGLMAWREQELFPIFEDCIKDAEQAALDQTGYLQCFGRTEAMSARSLWQYLYARVSDDLPVWAKPALTHILTNGTLSTRIKRELGDAPTLDQVKTVYRRLADCANANQMF